MLDDKLNEVPNIAVSEISAISKSNNASLGQKLLKNRHNAANKLDSDGLRILFSKSPESVLRKELWIELIQNEGYYTPKYDYLFSDFPEDSTLELEGVYKTNKPLLFNAKEMNLKRLK